MLIPERDRVPEGEIAGEARVGAMDIVVEAIVAHPARASDLTLGAESGLGGWGRGRGLANNEVLVRRGEKGEGQGLVDDNLPGGIDRNHLRTVRDHI